MCWYVTSGGGELFPKTKTCPWLGAILGVGGETPDTSSLPCHPQGQGLAGGAAGRHWEPVLGRPAQSSHRICCSSPVETEVNGIYGGPCTRCPAGKGARRGAGFPGGSVIKNPPANAEDTDSPPAPGRPPYSLAQLGTRALRAGGRPDQEFSWGSGVCWSYGCRL